MFNGVRGEGIKKFFKGRKGRNLSFASNEPIKVKAGADIEEIAQGAVDKNTDNLIIASLKATIEDLKLQLAVKEDKALRSKLEWAEEYLTKFQAEVDKIRKKKPTPIPQQPDKVEHELKTILKNLKMQSDRILKSLGKLPFLMVQDNFEETQLEIEAINSQVSLYEQGVKAYKDKGGKEEYPKIVFGKLKVIYKLVARKIDEFKDELKETSVEKYELKQNIVLLEKFADDLEKFAESPEIYRAIRTEVDQELAAAKKKTVEPQPVVEPPLNPPKEPAYQGAINKYEELLNNLNQLMIELNSYISRVEKLNESKDLTPEIIREYIELDEKIKKCNAGINSLKISLEEIRREVRNENKIDIAKLTCIQNIKLETISHKSSYAFYIESLDRKAIDVISRIKDLELSKTNAKKEELNKINDEIATLYRFLLAINSLVDTRIVHYSKVNRRNINDLYKSRLKKRKEIAEEKSLIKPEQKPVIPEGKTEIEVFKESVAELSDSWLTAIKTAPIDRKGLILLDETLFAEAMSILIAQSHDEAKLKIVMEASNQFNAARTQLIKQKRTLLNKFREKVTTRITFIFQSGTIAENVEPGIDYNEWLTEIEYSELLLLASEPEYLEFIPNTKALVNEYIADQEKKYQGIKKKQQSDVIKKLSTEFAELIARVEEIPLDENFEVTVQSIFDSMKTKYRVLKDFECSADLTYNVVIIKYQINQYQYSSGSYKVVPQEFPHVIMSRKKHAEYKVSRNLVPPTVAPVEEPKKDEDDKKTQIKFGENSPIDAKVTNRTLKLATNRRQVIDRAKNLIIKNADPITVSLIKQGLKIRYNENLRDQLKSLNAKLSLVNKNNYRSRKSIRFDGEETVQELAFKSPKEDFKIEDYKLELRLVDDEKKRSDLLYTYDLEQISNDLHGRTK